MFGSHRKNRKNSIRRRARAKARTSLRFFGVESMERRLMLSATIGDTPTVQVPTIDPPALNRIFVLCVGCRRQMVASS